MKRKGFTLVELIIVITILAILATISLINFWSFSGVARDGIRKSDLKNIEKALQLYQIEKWNFPSSGENNTFWEEQYLAVRRLSNLPVDPGSKKKYSYEILEWWQVYKLEAILENWEKFILTNIWKKDDSINNISDIRETNNIVTSWNNINYDSKNRITRIEIRDNRRLYNWVYYKWLRIKFTKEMLDSINTIKATEMRVDDWWELKVNWKSIISWPFPRIQWLVFCTLDNKNVISHINSDILQIDDPYDIIDDRELNAYNDIWSTSDFYSKYKISENNDCTQGTSYWLEQMWTWTIRDWNTIYWAENNITTPYIWVWSRWSTPEKASYIYEAINFKNILKEWYNNFDLTAFVWGSWNVSTTIEITYND